MPCVEMKSLGYHVMVSSWIFIRVFRSTPPTLPPISQTSPLAQLCRNPKRPNNRLAAGVLWRATRASRFISTGNGAVYFGQIKISPDFDGRICLAHGNHDREKARGKRVRHSLFAGVNIGGTLTACRSWRQGAEHCLVVCKHVDCTPLHVCVVSTPRGSEGSS